MGFDCGFDVYPTLERTEANQEKYQHFINEVLRAYEVNPTGGYGSTADCVAEVITKKNGAYIEFKVGEHPILPYGPNMCHYFIRFSSKVSGPSTRLAEPFINGVYEIARRRFGDRVKWWHELREQTGDIRDAYGYYDWRQVYRVQGKMRNVLDGLAIDDGDNGLNGEENGQKKAAESGASDV